MPESRLTMLCANYSHDYALPVAGYNAWIHRSMHAVKSILCARHVDSMYNPWGSIVFFNLKFFFSFYSQSKQIKHVQQRHKQNKQNTIAKANLCINKSKNQNKLRISRLNTGREVEVNASTGKLFQREMVAGRKE